MKQLFRLFIIMVCFFEISCATQNTYQEPAANEKVAYIKLQNEDIPTGVAKTLILMPSYELNISKIDHLEYRDFWGKNMIKIAPGQHKITVDCILSSRGTPMKIGNKTFNIHAVPGKIYTISYPADFKGYFVHFGACKYVTLK